MLSIMTISVISLDWSTTSAIVICFIDLCSCITYSCNDSKINYTVESNFE